jgi:streptogramin lyase
MRKNIVASLALLAGTIAGCGEDEPQGCVTDRACCVLAQGGAGQAGCVAHDVEWGSSADLAAAGLENQDGVLTLLPNTTTRVPVVWVTSTDENKVAKFDSVTGAELLRVPVFGQFPNRTAVAADGSVWITDRDSYQYVHVGGNGDILCSSPQGSGVGPGYTRAAAIDSQGNVWIGLNDLGQLIKVDPTATDGTVDVADFSPDNLGTVTVPRCREITTVDLLGADGVTRTYPYGLAGDGEGHVWVGVLTSGSVAKVDVASATVIGQYDPSVDPTLVAAGGCWSMYGMAIDLDGNPWFANYGCGNIVKLDKNSGAVVGVYTDPVAGMSGARALGLDKNGHIWVAENYASFVDEFLPDGTWVKKVDIQSCGGSPTPGTLGTGSDIDGNMWTVLQTAGKIVKYSTAGAILGCYPESVPPNVDLAGPYTYSDLTGSTLALVTSDLGRWRGTVNNADELHWLLVAYQATVPEGTQVCARVRTALTEAGLDSAPWTQPYCDHREAPEWTLVNLDDDQGQPIDNVIDSKFLEIEVQLSSSDATVSPSVSGISVAARAPAAP